MKSLLVKLFRDHPWCCYHWIDFYCPQWWTHVRLMIDNVSQLWFSSILFRITITLKKKSIKRSSSFTDHSNYFKHHHTNIFWDDVSDSHVKFLSTKGLRMMIRSCLTKWCQIKTKFVPVWVFGQVLLNSFFFSSFHCGLFCVVHLGVNLNKDHNNK